MLIRFWFGYDMLILANNNLVPTKVIKLSSFNMQGNHTFDCLVSLFHRNYDISINVSVKIPN